MPKKIYFTKGRCPRPNKTDRTEVSEAMRHGMVVKSLDGISQHKIAEFYGKPQCTVSRTLKDATERAERRGNPLSDIENVQRTPGKRKRPVKFGTPQKEEIVKKVKFGREPRELKAHEWIEDLELNCSESTFTKMMYEYRLHFLPGAEKPELSPKLQSIRLSLAQMILDYDVRRIIFIDQANIRSEYGGKPTWHTPEEKFHKDVKIPTTKQAYSKGEIMGAIKYNEPPGPHKIYLKETLAEQNEAEGHMKRMRAEQMEGLRAEFDAQEAAKDVSITSPNLLRIF